MTEDLKKIKDLLEVRNCSDNTVESYLGHISRFKKYFEGREIQNLTEEDILEYLIEKIKNLNLSSSTYNVCRAAIKYYYAVNFRRELSSILLPSVKIEKRYPLVLDYTQFELIINSTDNIKHKLWLSLGYGSGLRIDEVATLRMGNFSFSQGKIRVIGKGNKERFVPFPAMTHDLLLEYYKMYKDKINVSGGYLFPSCSKNSKCGHITTNAIEDMFDNLRVKLNLNESITFHTLRHSFATDYIRNGGDIWELKIIMGHVNISSTFIYVHMAKDYKLIHSPLDKNS